MGKKGLVRLVVWCRIETSLHEKDICHSYKDRILELMANKSKKKIEIVNMSFIFSHF